MKLEKEGNWEEYPDYSKKVIIDPHHDLEVNFLIQKVRVKPSTKSKIHFHKNQKEIFIVLKNSGYFIVNDKKISVKEGDTLKISPGEKHAVGNDSHEEFEFLAIKLNYDKMDTFQD